MDPDLVEEYLLNEVSLEVNVAQGGSSGSDAVPKNATARYPQAPSSEEKPTLDTVKLLTGNCSNVYDARTGKPLDEELVRVAKKGKALRVQWW